MGCLPLPAGQLAAGTTEAEVMCREGAGVGQRGIGSGERGLVLQLLACSLSTLLLLQRGPFQGEYKGTLPKLRVSEALIYPGGEEWLAERI